MNDQERCPICNSAKYRYVSYAEYGWGTVEQHGHCKHCGYRIEQAYSKPIVGFELAQVKGRKFDGVYYPKNIRRRKRLRRKFGIRHNPKDWMLCFI